MTAHAKHDKGIATDRARLITAVVVAAGLLAICLYAFAGLRPFSSARTVRVNVANAYQVKPGDPVRVAGTRVGTVEGVDAGPHDTAVLRLAIDDGGLVIHRDAHVEITTRLFVEGSFYIDLRPGSPTAPELGDSAMLPVAQTSGPVQLDQVISMLTQPTREALRSTVHELGAGLAPDAPAPHPVPLRRAVEELRRALPPAGVVLGALRGRRAGDLGRTMKATAEVTSQLAGDPTALADLVTNTRRTADALGADDSALAGTVQQFALLLRKGPADLPAIDRGLASVRHIADAADPTLRAIPRTAPAITALLRELGTVSGPALLPRALALARPVLTAIPELGLRLQELSGELRPALACLTHNVLPTLETKVPDGQLSTGRPAWQDLLHATAGLSSLSAAFDGNATTIRLGGAGGDNLLEGTVPGLGAVGGNAAGVPVGIRPVAPWRKPPPYRPDARCSEQAPPDLGAGLQVGTTSMHRVRSGRPALSGKALRRLLERVARNPAAPHHNDLPTGRRPLIPVARPAPGAAPAQKQTLEVPVPNVLSRGADTIGGLLDYLLGPTKGGGG